MGMTRRLDALSYLGKRLTRIWQEEEAEAGERMEKVEKNLFGTIKRLGKRLARSLLEDVLTAYCVMRDPDTPWQAKAILAGALVYFIQPFDVIPDVMPMGLVDDAAILAAALERVGRYTDDRHRDEARAILDKLFGEKEAIVPAS
ncbi:YkvA family protein [Parvularcula mediterranea]|nr:DUF1232 domain-containing protein [Parvularcula mediterranea]